MSDKVQCETHGETDQAFVCSHLARESHGLGFNCEVGPSESPFPDAWCDDCEIIRAAHDGWTDESQKLVKIALACTKCYERTRIRNTKPAVTLDDLADLRWKCGTCEEWHYGPCLDIGFSKPHYWPKDHEMGERWTITTQDRIEKKSKSFLDKDYCAIDDEEFFVRGILHLPIVGTAQSFCWGIWGSLSRANFETYLRLDACQDRADLPPMSSWLSSRIPDYPDTLNLRLRVQTQKPGSRPHFEIEPTDHPLSQEFHHGILPERVKEIVLRQMGNAEQPSA